MKKQPRTNCSIPGHIDVRPKTICCVGGKSAGHILPCLTLSQHLQPCQSLFFSSNGRLDKKILQEEKSITWHISLPLAKVRYCRPWGILKLLWSFFCALYHMIRHQPSLLLTTGGISAIPVSCAAFLLRIPITLHELNAKPGKASLLLAPLAKKITICFPETKKNFSRHHHKIFLSSYPLRFDPSQLKRHQIRKKLEIKQEKHVLCIVGGSQGSQFINSAIKTLFKQSDTISNRLHVIHQVGFNDVAEQEQWYKQQGISCTVFSYTNNLLRYQAAADCIICRSGAGSLFECAALGIQFITIPLEHAAGGHQVDNAYAMARSYPKLCRVLRQKELINQPELLANAVTQIITATPKILSSKDGNRISS